MGALCPVERHDVLLGNVRVPRSLLADCATFGGTRDGDCIAGSLVIRNGRVAGMTSEPGHADLRGRLVTQPFVEAHCHLDKCFTAERIDFRGGTLAQAIAAQARDKSNWHETDIRARAERGLAELARSGTSLARTHVDWDVDPKMPDQVPLAWRVMSELAEEWRDRLTLQCAALLPVEALADEAYATSVARTLKRAEGVLGAFVFNQPARRAGIRNMIRAARQHGLALDFHVDEGLDPLLDGFEIIAEEMISAGHDGPVLCGHVCNLATIDSETRARRIELALRAGISVVTLPTSNLYLQDRGKLVARERGLTAVGELIRAGVSTVFGTDNVQDAFCPIGLHNPAASLQTTVLVAQLEPPVASWLPHVMGQASGALGVRSTPIENARIDELIIWEASSVGTVVGAAYGIGWQPLSDLCLELETVRQRGVLPCFGLTQDAPPRPNKGG